jgi:hypothetical protein
MDHPYLQFFKGLAEFRRECPAEAIPLLEAAAARLRNRPGARLVLAMTESRTGQPEAAQRSLALAVRNYDWGISWADHPTEGAVGGGSEVQRGQFGGSGVRASRPSAGNPPRLPQLRKPGGF